MLSGVTALKDLAFLSVSGSLLFGYCYEQLYLFSLQVHLFCYHILLSFCLNLSSQCSFPYQATKARPIPTHTNRHHTDVTTTSNGLMSTQRG